MSHWGILLTEDQGAGSFEVSIRIREYRYSSSMAGVNVRYTQWAWSSWFSQKFAWFGFSLRLWCALEASQLCSTTHLTDIPAPPTSDQKQSAICEDSLIKCKECQNALTFWTTCFWPRMKKLWWLFNYCCYYLTHQCHNSEHCSMQCDEN